MRRSASALLLSLACVLPLLLVTTAAAAEPRSTQELVSRDSAISAVLVANGGKAPATGEQLWRTLGRLGKFAQLPVPFSSVRLNTGLTAPRVVIAPVGGALGTAAPTDVNFAGRLYLAANMERAPGENPRVTSVEFISWNGARRAFDFGFIEKMGTDSPRLEVVDGGACFVCHKNRGPILGVRPWSNTTHDDNMRYALARSLNMTGSKLPESGSFVLQAKGKFEQRLDRIDGMALARPEAPEVDASVRAGAGILERRDTFRLLARTPEGRRAIGILLVAMMEPGVLDPKAPGVAIAVDAATEKIYTRFASDWMDMRRTAKLSAIVDADPAGLLLGSGVRNRFVAFQQWPDFATPSPPGIVKPNGTRWIAPDVNWAPLMPVLALQARTEPEKAARKLAIEAKFQELLALELPITFAEIEGYDAARAAGRHGLLSGYQPSNPHAFIRPAPFTPRRVSELVSAPLLAETIGVTDGDRRWLNDLLTRSARSLGVKNATLSKDVFAASAFADMMSGGALPDREEFKDRFVEGLAEVLDKKHGRSVLSADRREYASGPRYDPQAVAEKEAAVVPTSACLRCHEVAPSGIASKFTVVPPLPFDPFDAAGRQTWLRDADARTKGLVLARLIRRLATDADMPPEDSPEHTQFKMKSAESFAEAKRYLATELDKLKPKAKAK